MRIHRIRVDKYGPLRDLSWKLPSTGVVYDDNMTGKTALVDLIIRHLFVPRKGSRLFQNYSRFSGEEEGNVKLELREGRNSYLFGTEGEGVNLKKLFGWEEEGLFRLLCIRAGDNRLVAGGKGRSSVFNAVASLVSGAGTEKLERIKRDLESRFRITRGNRWSNRKETQPPKIKDRINDEILPFLKNFSARKETLHEFEEAKARIRELESELDRHEKEKKRIERGLDLFRAEKLERHLNKIRKLKREKEKYARVEEKDLKLWQDTRAKLENCRGQLAERDHRDRNVEERVDELKEEIKEKQKLMDKELEREISALRDQKNELQKKINFIEEKIEERKRDIIDFLREEIREPLKELGQLKEKRSNLGLWQKYRFVFDTLAMGLVLFGGLAAFFATSYLGLTSLIGLALGAVTRRKLAVRKSLTEEIAELEEEITRKFNSRFDSVLDREVDKVNRLEAAIDLIPDRVEEQQKRERGLKEIKDKKQSLKGEINRLELRSAELPEEIEELKEEKEGLSDRISRAQQGIKETRSTLSDLRDRTNLPDLPSLKEKLQEKEEVETSLRDERVALAEELGSTSKDDQDLLSRARETVKDLRENPPENEDPIEQNSAVPDLSRREAKGKLKDLGEEISSKRKEIRKARKRLEKLRKDLSEHGIDPSSPAQLFRKKRKKEKQLKEFTIDRVAGSLAKQVLKDVSRDYLNNLDRFISGRSVEKTVQSLFRQVMGKRFGLNFDHDKNEFLVEERKKSYPESDLSSGARKHLLLSTRLALIDKLTTNPAFLVLDDPFLFYHKEKKRKAIKQFKRLRDAGWQIIFFTVDEQTRNGVVEDLDGKEFSISDLVEKPN